MGGIDLMSEAVRVRELTRKFGDFTAVDRVTFHVAHGEIFGFLGPNGSGNTTTISMLLGLLRPSDGTALVLGHVRIAIEQFGHRSPWTDSIPPDVADAIDGTGFPDRMAHGRVGRIRSRRRELWRS